MCLIASSFNPVTPLENATDQIGKWVSDAPGVASDSASAFEDGVTTVGECAYEGLTDGGAVSRCHNACEEIADVMGEYFAPPISLPNPVEIAEASANQVGKWVSDAPGVASDATDFTFGTFTEAEMLRAAAGEALGLALCGFAKSAVANAPTPATRAVQAAAVATCLASQYEGAVQVGTDLGDDD